MTTTVSSQSDDRHLAEKLKQAEATFDRARTSLKSGKLTVDHRRYLNQLLTGMVITESVMSW